MIHVALVRTGFLEPQRRSLCAVDAAVEGLQSDPRCHSGTVISWNVERHTTCGRRLKRGLVSSPRARELQARKAFRYEGETRSLKHLPRSLGNPIFVAAQGDCLVSRPGL
jgi:hypothetical protein